MEWEAIKQVCDLLALVGSKGGYVDQRPHPFGPCQGNDRTGVSVTGYHDGTLSPVQAAVECSHVVSKGS
jgi:hypothetical protein